MDKNARRCFKVHVIALETIEIEHMLYFCRSSSMDDGYQYLKYITLGRIGSICSYP